MYIYRLGAQRTFKAAPYNEGNDCAAESISV